MGDENPISYDIDADKQFKQAMSKAITSGLDLSFSMGESVRIIKKESTKNFTLAGFGQYPPLSPKYFARKQRVSPGTPILTGIRGGKLKNSIINTTADSIVLIGKRSVEFGTKAKSSKGYPYPLVVQHGTKDKKTPGRKFLFFSQAMVKQIINTVDADIDNQLPK